MKKSKSKNKNSSTLNIKRFFAVLIDWYIASMLAGVPVILIHSSITGNVDVTSSLIGMPKEYALLAGGLAIGVGLAYYILIPLVWNKGQTLGKRILGVKVTNLDGSEVSTLNLCKREILGVAIIEGSIICTSGYLREIVYFLSNANVYFILSILGTIVTVISIVILFRNKDSRMIHDFIGNTKVIQVS